ncbi:MAG: hypothetical protein K2N30_04860 [Clostridia bacterium]|nr:hypothetical protein [Clostridia bacterium]
MLRYFYAAEKDRLYVYDNESGYFMSFNKYTNKWEIPFSSFMQVEHDNDDFAVISEEAAKKISNGVNFDEDYKNFLSIIASVRNSDN